MLVSAAALLAGGCGTMHRTVLDPTKAEAERYARTRDLQAEVDSLAQPLVTDGTAPGIAIGVLVDGQRHFFVYGVGDKRTGARLDAETLFAIGSVSKGFLGTLTAMLVEEGVLSWIHYQIGVVAGYTSYVGIDVEHRTAVVVLKNSFEWTASIGPRLLNRLAVALSATPPPP